MVYERDGRGGYKGKNFDPNYQQNRRVIQNFRRSIRGSTSSDGSREINSSNNSSGNTVRSSSSDRSRNTFRSAPRTSPRLHRDNPWHSSGPRDIHPQVRYFHRIRHLAAQADAWMCICTCTEGVTECHSALIKQYDSQGHEYRVQLAASEHQVEVLRLTLDKFIGQMPHHRCFIKECYEAADQDVSQRELESL